jgi:hypothetical protein
MLDVELNYQFWQNKVGLTVMSDKTDFGQTDI